MKISQASAYALHALMYMTRHVTQLPVTSKTIARAEGIPEGYLAKVLQQLAKAGFIRSVKGRDRGYVFAKPPEEVSLLDLFDALEEEPLFDDCPLRHCACGGTKDNCLIFAQWTRATRRFRELLSETTIASCAWHHPEHRFHEPPGLAINLSEKEEFLKILTDENG
jgi:Rrf2 family protein